MSISNLRLPSPLFSVQGIAWLAGFMLVFWAPFWGGHRLPLLLLLGIGLYLHLRGRGWVPTGLPERRWGLLFLLLVLPCLASATTSLAPRDSWTTVLVLLLHYWVGLALLRGLGGNGHAAMAGWIGLVLLLWLADGMVQWVFGVDLLGIPMNEGRVVGFFADNLHLGLFVMVLMPLLLWPLAERRPWLAIWAFVALSGLAVLSGARTNVVFALLVMLGLFVKLKVWRHRAALAVLCLAPVVLVPFSPQLKSRTLEYDYGRLATVLSAKDTKGLFLELDQLSSHRLVIWETGFRMAQDRPFLGVGPKAFDPVYGAYAHRETDPFLPGSQGGNRTFHAHQMYVSALAETGLVGLMGLLAAIALCFRWYQKSPPDRRAAATPYAVCLAIIAFPVNSQPVLFLGWWFPIVLLLLCGMLAALDGEDASPKPGRE